MNLLASVLAASCFKMKGIGLFVFIEGGGKLYTLRSSLMCTGTTLKIPVYPRYTELHQIKIATDLISIYKRKCISYYLLKRGILVRLQKHYLIICLDLFNGLKIAKVAFYPLGQERLD